MDEIFDELLKLGSKRFAVPRTSYFTNLLCHSDQKTSIFSSFIKTKKGFSFIQVFHETVNQSNTQELGQLGSSRIERFKY